MDKVEYRKSLLIMEGERNFNYPLMPTNQRIELTITSNYSALWNGAHVDPTLTSTNYSVDYGSFSGYFSDLQTSGGKEFNFILPKDSTFRESEFDMYDITINLITNHQNNDFKIIIDSKNSQYLSSIEIKSKEGASNFHIKELVLKNISKQVIIQDGIIDNIYYSYGGNVSINNCQINSGIVQSTNNKILEFINTDLGEIYFSNLEKITTRINNSNFSKIQLNNVTFKKIIEDGMKIGEIKELYRHIKYLYDSIGNKTEANKFFAKEMFYNRKSLWLDKDYGAWFVSLLQLVSNNYGAFWWLPLLWIVGISFIYTLFANCPNFSCVCGNTQDWNCFSIYWLKNVSQFPTELKNASNWWFFFYSIVMGSLIYQFLIALRRISQR